MVTWDQYFVIIWIFCRRWRTLYMLNCFCTMCLYSFTRNNFLNPVHIMDNMCSHVALFHSMGYNIYNNCTMHIFRCQQTNLCTRAFWCWTLLGSWCLLNWPKGCCDNCQSHWSRSVPLYMICNYKLHLLRCNLRFPFCSPFLIFWAKTSIIFYLIIVSSPFQHRKNVEY